MTKYLRRATLTKKMQMVFIDEIQVNFPNPIFDLIDVKVDCKRKNDRQTLKQTVAIDMHNK